MRYNRQIMLPELGRNGQLKLQQTKVLIVGVGGLGSPIALYLTGAGIGTIGLMDDDVVSISNLQRQILYTEKDVNQPKAICAAHRLNALNSEVIFEPHFTRLSEENAYKLIAPYDIVVDGCDNFATRYLIDQVCADLGKTYVYGAISQFEGQVSVFHYQTDPYSYHDLYPNKEEIMQQSAPSKAVLGVTPAVVGCIEATEVLKIAGEFGEVLSGKLWTIDLLSMQSNIILF